MGIRCFQFVIGPGQRTGSLRHKGRWAASPPGPSAFIGDENGSSFPFSSRGKGERHVQKAAVHTTTFPLRTSSSGRRTPLRIQSERLHQNAARLRVHAEKLPYGTERETLIGWARQMETANEIDERI